jgi:hypothetical protein
VIVVGYIGSVCMMDDRGVRMNTMTESVFEVDFFRRARMSTNEHLSKSENGSDELSSFC